MEIHSLRATLTERDLNDLAKKHLSADSPVEDVYLQLSPEGVTVKGVYPLFVNVAFETRWELCVQEGKLAARLAGFRAMGIPGNVFRSAIFKLLADAVKKKDWVTINGDWLLADLDRLLGRNGLSARTCLTHVACCAGSLTIEAGARD
jgi:hypothetical protein